MKKSAAMTLKTLSTCVIVVPFCLALSVAAHSGDDDFKSMKERVLDALFAVEDRTPPYLTKTTLRYGDTDTQVAVLTYFAYPKRPSGQAEVIRYSIAGMSKGGLSDFIDKTVARKPSVTAREIADMLKVDVAHFSVDYDMLMRLMKDLKAIQIAPVLQTRVATDNYSVYDFWFDTGQEFVHYSITGPSHGSPQDRLVEWMIRFRTRLPDLVKTSSGPRQ